jgi:hypothetical protein
VVRQRRQFGRDGGKEKLIIMKLDIKIKYILTVRTNKIGELWTLLQ